MNTSGQNAQRYAPMKQVRPSRTNCVNTVRVLRRLAKIGMNGSMNFAIPIKDKVNACGNSRPIGMFGNTKHQVTLSCRDVPATGQGKTKRNENHYTCKSGREANMKIHFNPKDFSPMFRLAASVANSKDYMPILQNVKIIADKQIGVILQATDTEVGIRIRIDCDVSKEGEAILPKDRLLKVLDLTKSERLTLEYSEGKIVVDGEDKEHYKLDTMLSDEFPYIEEFGATAYHEIPAKALQEVIQRTIFAVDCENIKYALGGVSFEMTSQVISTVGTDGRRLAWQDCSGESINDHKVETAIVPARTLQLLNRALSDKSIGEGIDVKMAVAEGMVWFQCQDITLFSRLIEGRYPKWRNIIPKIEGKELFTVDCEPLLSAIMRAQVTTSDLDPGVDFSFDKGKLTLQGEGKERGNSKIEVPISFSDISKKVKIDPKFMTDFLRVLDGGKKVSIYLPPEAGEPIKITADDGGYVYVLMPMSS